MDSAATMSNPLISVYPEELTFKFKLEKQSYCDLKLVNNTEHHVAFKVKTTSPKKYFVRPNTDVVQPWDSCLITVTLQAQRDYPPDMQCRDKFLVQSTIVPPSIDIDEVPPDAFNIDGDKVIEECKLRVVYTAYSGHGLEEEFPSFSRSSKQSSETNSLRSCSSMEDIQGLQRLKEEKDAAVQKIQQLEQEMEVLKNRISRRGDSDFSLNFAAFVGLIGLLVGFLLNFALSAPSTK